jgi:predicted nucleic acid-binding protein
VKLLDTSVAIDFLRSSPAAVSVVDAALAEGIGASEITRFEVLSGMLPQEQDATEEFFELLDVFPVVESVARRGAQLAQRYRASHQGIEDADYLIAATALELGAALLTTNVRHFPMLAGLEPAYGSG